MNPILSIIAIVLSVASLAWQAFTWRRGGPRPRVLASIETIEDQRATLIVKLRNQGRGACQVEKIQLVATSGRRGMGLDNYVQDGQPALPVTLASTSGAELRYDASSIAHALHHHGGLGDRFYVRIEVGDGSTRQTPGSLTFADCLRLDDKPGEHGRVLKKVQRAEPQARRRSRGAGTL